MKHNKAFKQFAKDCPKHFSEDVLKDGSLTTSIQFQHVKKEKTTRNSTIRNRF